ncbi:hypothetical protein PYW08_011387 [Mythimna loreyi]|uniref:Uncharacterized protein n=1 Tax=Mythimna loreyi TaxID=667449 RepID=A0ACC2Q3T4_9NEOP|nr:hypothetical protein PYW08_011387 [Mythimna loreyi]
MDLKEIIKWFIPCFHILLLKKIKMCGRLTFICLFLLFISRPSYGQVVDSNSLVSKDIDTKNVVNLSYLGHRNNQSDYFGEKMESNEERNVDTSIGRTFGRPMKKMMQALIPLVFQIGAASTWAVVAALVGIKTLLVTLVILKLLLVAGAAKVGALFASKTHGSSHGWEAPHQKEIHLHIHNGGHPEVHDEHGAILSEWKQAPITSTGAPNSAARVVHVASSPPVGYGYYFGPPQPTGGFKPLGYYIGAAGWSREGIPAATAPDNKNINLVINPYAAAAGPQTISTPYGNYVRIDRNALSSLSSIST